MQLCKYSDESKVLRCFGNIFVYHYEYQISVQNVQLQYYMAQTDASNATVFKWKLVLVRSQQTFLLQLLHVAVCTTS